MVDAPRFVTERFHLGLAKGLRYATVTNGLRFGQYLRITDGSYRKVGQIGMQKATESRSTKINNLK